MSWPKKLLMKTSSFGSQGHAGAALAKRHSPRDDKDKVERVPEESSEFTVQDVSLGVKCADMHAIVDICINCYDGNIESLDQQPRLPKMVYLIHRWYKPSDEMAGIYLDLFRRRGHCTEASCSHTASPCALYLYRVKLCLSLRHWIRQYPMHFAKESTLPDIISELKALYTEAGLHDLALVFDTSQVPCYEWNRNMSARAVITKQTSLSFDQWTPDDIATNLTHIEHRLLRRISFSEYKQYAIKGNLESTPTLERSIAIFNSLSQWVQCMVLSKSSAKDRAEIMSKFINVSKRLRELQNYNTLMAVVGGLCHSAIARLGKTQAALSPEAKRALSELTDLLQSGANFSTYRRALAECRGFRIPIIGVHLKDLISLHNATPDYVQDDKIHCQKLLQLAFIFAHLIKDLERVPNYPEANVDLMNTLKCSLYIQHHTDDEIYEMSTKREPRTLLNHMVSNACQKPVVFAAWAADVSSTPDTETLRKHITAMVEAVFKHYDTDEDGYISHAEFQSIIGNFPFIDPFRVLDADHDGMISKTEMIKYFVEANRSAATNLRKNFRHNFHETTFLAPTTCVHCSKVLWGLLRQGVKCKDCHIPVHRTCKDSVVEECRRRSAGSYNFERTQSFPGHSGGSYPPEKLKSRFLKYKQQRTVSTVSPESPVEPSPVPPATAPAVLLDPKTILSNAKKRSLSESQSESYYGRSCTPDQIPSLASEEVFEEESSNPPSSELIRNGSPPVDSGCGPQARPCVRGLVIRRQNRLDG